MAGWFPWCCCGESPTTVTCNSLTFYLPPSGGFQVTLPSGSAVTPYGEDPATVNDDECCSSYFGTFSLPLISTTPSTAGCAFLFQTTEKSLTFDCVATTGTPRIQLGIFYNLTTGLSDFTLYVTKAYWTSTDATWQLTNQSVGTNYNQSFALPRTNTANQLYCWNGSTPNSLTVVPA